ncbi:DUF6351 family protein [Nocardiopsis sp. MG754419]|uniref:DUF6351 family protein n=1 Tax=Nocardiopsis sp. MG754419 TaxID=2259865 RepID=UPI0027DBB612|nr:DUF6351 family protein [Nocardiopsis sp. MG754419]
MATLFTISAGALAEHATALNVPSSAAPSERPPEDDREGPRISVLSSRPDTVMGDTVLVRVEPPAPHAPQRVRLESDGHDVTDALRPVYLPGVGQVLEGLVSGLSEGPNTLVASVDVEEDQEAASEGYGDAPAPVALTVTAHPLSGPVFSGPHQEPFVCQTEDFSLAWGGTLGAPVDEDCSVPTRVGYVYRSTDGAFKALPDEHRLPLDVATTTTGTGEKVPYTVRVETGTVNRSVYETAVLHDPRGPEPDPWTAPEGWNRRLVHKFGGGCPGGWYVQGDRTAGVIDHGMLSRGYAVVSASLNVFGNNCNDLVAAETAVATKERFTLSYGAPDHTLGWGNSGGAYQAHQIADNHPGVLDGVLVSQSYPDVGSGTVPAVTDALLLRSYANAHPDALTADQLRAVSGFGDPEGIDAMADAATRIDPRGVCPDALPESERYHPEDRPDGARCDLYAHTVNVYGTDPDTGLPRRPLDNVGIQYGLSALEDGDIDVDAFLHLNEHIGGFDLDGAVVADRTEGDHEAIAAAYDSGRVLHGGGGLADIPVVDHRPYQDDAPDGDIHMRYHSFSTRERLQKANGTVANHVMLVERHRSGVFDAAEPVAGRALVELDTWVGDAARDARVRPHASPIERVERTRPDWLTDSCWVEGERIITPLSPTAGGPDDPCAETFPVHGSPRTVAGGPLSSDVIKCRLTPFDATGLAVAFDEEQTERAREVFTEGVCDWSSPGVEQRAPQGPWQFF